MIKFFPSNVELNNAVSLLDKEAVSPDSPTLIPPYRIQMLNWSLIQLNDFYGYESHRLGFRAAHLDDIKFIRDSSRVPLQLARLAKLKSHRFILAWLKHVSDKSARKVLHETSVHPNLIS